MLRRGSPLENFLDTQFQKFLLCKYTSRSSASIYVNFIATGLVTSPMQYFQPRDFASRNQQFAVKGKKTLIARRISQKSLINFLESRSALIPSYKILK